MTYKATIRSKAQSATGYGDTDHAAVMSAWASLSGVSSTDCRVVVHYQYANCDDEVYVQNLFQYFEESK
jgi:hypothetical protein